GHDLACGRVKHVNIEIIGRSRRAAYGECRRVPLKRHDEACARRQGDSLEDIATTPGIEVVRGPAEERWRASSGRDGTLCEDTACPKCTLIALSSLIAGR